MIKRIFKLDDTDISYLTDNAPPERILIVDNDNKKDIQDMKQPDMFPELKPLNVVDYANEHQGRNEKTNISISKVAQKITGIVKEKSAPIIVSCSGSKKSIETTISLTATSPEWENLLYPVSFFDRIVEDAIGNLVDQGCSKITAAMVYRQIHGITVKKGIDKSTSDKINKTIKKLATTWITLDFTEQLKAINPKVQNGIVKSHILHAEYIKIRFNDGTITDGWKILDAPVIYNYSKQVKQIATIPTAILQTTDIHKSTEEITAAKYYLISQIERIKRKPEHNRILLDTLFETIKDTAAQDSRTIKKRRVTAICGILDFFKRKNYIRDYKVITQNRGKIDGFTISVYDKNTKEIE